MKIGNFTIGKDQKVFVIAEVGNNHNGDIDKAIKLIDFAVEAGADCVKFQMRSLKHVYRERAINNEAEDLGTEYVLSLLKRYELSLDQHRQVANYCKEKGILYLCTAWDENSIDNLEDFGVPAYKVASADLTNINLLEKLIKLQKPLILSTGMSSEEEIFEAISLLNKSSATFALLHCNSTYPAPFQDINLRWMNKLMKYHDLVGYSGHERGVAVTLASVALGACIVERHLTLNRNMEGPDHAASLEPVEFKMLVNGIREIELALGSGVSRKMSQGEMMNRENLGKSLVAARKLKKNEIIKYSDVKVCSPGQGLSPQKITSLLGKKINRDMDYEDFFYDSDVEVPGQSLEKEYSFSRPWGLPVRYHDINRFIGSTNLNLVEFHLSSSDLDYKYSDTLFDKYDEDFLVHAPELFSDSHLMDFASADPEYLEKTIAETQKVIDITSSLKKYFPKTSKPLIIANVGGFSMDKPIEPHLIPNLYKRVLKNLQKLDTTGVEIIPQTMAPFPWHFGGQRYQNLFVKKEEIVSWCEETNMRICLDVSHSMLACNHYNVDFYDFVKCVGPYTAHIHLGDAAGVNGEGLQIDEGEINFELLFSILNETCPEASFIPEIWQGHKNQGAAFWTALDRLSKYANKFDGV